MTHIATALGAAILLCGSLGHAQAQSSCASDGVPQPAVLVERFLDAGCEACWADAGSSVAADALVLDWIVPGAAGADAPLAAAARRDGTERLASVGAAMPATGSTRVRSQPVRGADLGLRVAHGLAVNDYVGASIAYLPPQSAASGGSAWLVLVERISAGTEGTPIARNLVRNTLQLPWPLPGLPADQSIAELRAMALAEGVRPERLGVVGWLQDAEGRVLAAVESRCAAAVE
jgi:hypothetical protein